MHTTKKRFVGLLTIFAVALVISGCKQAAAPSAPAANTNAVVPAANTNAAPEMPKADRVITVKGNNFAFDVKEIKVKKGERVQIDFVNEEGFHDWVVDEFNARTKQLQSGGTESIQFVADKTGTFEYYCSVGRHREFGMKGNLIVE